MLHNGLQSLKYLAPNLLAKSHRTFKNMTTPPSRTMSYSRKLVELFENPKHVGSLPKKDKNVGTGLVGAPACGDVMKLQIKVDETGMVTESKFKTFGCGSAMASSEIAAEWAQNKHIDELDKIQNNDIASYLKLPPVKLHCSMLAEDAIKAAVKDYKQKQQESSPKPKAIVNKVV